MRDKAGKVQCGNSGLFLEHLETATLSFPKVSISTVVLLRVFNKLFLRSVVDGVVVIVF